MKKSITAKLGGMLLGTFLPLNLLAIILSSIIIHQTSEQVQEAYQRELDTAMNGLVSDFENIEERFSGFLLRYMTELTLEEGTRLPPWRCWRISMRSGRAAGGRDRHGCMTRRGSGCT